MGSLLARAARRLSEPAVRHADGRDWRDASARFAATLPASVAASGPLPIADPDPLEYASQAIGALVAGRDIMLCNPRWTAAERAAAEAIRTSPAAVAGAQPRILIATGGSGGRLRFATHTPDTLEAAALALHRFYADGPLCSLCTLPLHHISGFQQLVRALATDGELVIADWHAIAAGQRPKIPSGDCLWMLSLVPTQLGRLLDDEGAVGWLRTFDTILLGGAAAGARLLREARAWELPIAIAYGSSETAAAVALEPVGDFLEDRHGLLALPHAALGLVDPDTGKPCHPGEIGRIEIEAESLFLGYWPEVRQGDCWTTDDLGRCSPKGRLHLLGRADAAINTGGEKVHPAEVEAALRELGASRDVVVLGIPDPRWGECVAAFHPGIPPDEITALEEGLGKRLSRFKLPKRWIAVPDWPLTAQGKTDRAALRRLA